MIEVINPSRRAQEDFFQKLLVYLQENDGVILRQIKKDFPMVDKLDKSLDSYIERGWIERKDKRYHLSLPLLQSIQDLALGQEVFVDSHAPIYQDLLELTFPTELRNVTNQVIIREKTGFAQEDLTLANYFFRLKQGYKPSPNQEALYQILGDVNPQYALKYMTTFLLKFLRKDLVKQKRPDIFVSALEILGYIEKVDEVSYSLQMDFDKEKFIFTSRK